MHRNSFHLIDAVRMVPRLLTVLILLLAPVLAVNTVRADVGYTIDAPSPTKNGAGLVLLVSLQRAQ